MKQMKKNSKQIQETVGSSSLYILSGDLEINDDELPRKIALYLKLDSRIVSIKDNEVSSISFNNPDKFVSEITQLIEQNDEDKILAIVSSQEEEKVVHVKKIKVSKKKGKKVLKMTASVEDLEASGNFAENSVNLEVPEGKVTLILQYWDPTYSPIG
jgi:hypothetical protein